MTRNMNIVQNNSNDNVHDEVLAFESNKTSTLSPINRGSSLSNSCIPSTSSSLSAIINTSTISEDMVDIEYFSEYSTTTSLALHSNYGSSCSVTYDYDEEVGEVAEDETNEIYLTRLLYSIDLFVFDDFTRPPHHDDQVIELPNNLLAECHVWRDKFRHKRGSRPKWSTESLILKSNNRQKTPFSYSLLRNTLHPTMLPQIPSSSGEPSSLQLNLFSPQLPSKSSESQVLQYRNNYLKCKPTRPPDLPISAWTRPQLTMSKRVTLPPLVDRCIQSPKKLSFATLASQSQLNQIKDLNEEDNWFIRAMGTSIKSSPSQYSMSFHWPNVHSEESRRILPPSSTTSTRRLRWSRDDSLTSMSSLHPSASSNVIRNRHQSNISDRFDLSYEENPKTIFHLPSIES